MGLGLRILCPGLRLKDAASNHFALWTEPSNPSSLQTSSEASGMNGSINMDKALTAFAVNHKVVDESSGFDLIFLHGSFKFKYW